MSSVQTKPVEKCCKIVNHLTQRYQKEKNNNLTVNIYGRCMGIDFASKLVGSKVGKDNRINNANLNLYFDTINIAQCPYTIICRLINKKQNTNINSICVSKNIPDDIVHTRCGTSKFIKSLYDYKQRYNNNVQITDLTGLSPGEQRSCC